MSQETVCWKAELSQKEATLREIGCKPNFAAQLDL